MHNTHHRITTNLRYPGLLNNIYHIDHVKVSVWSFGEIDPHKKTILGISGWPFSGYTLWPLGYELKEDVQFVALDIPNWIGFSSAEDFEVNSENVGKLFAKIPAILGLSQYGLFGISAGGAYCLSTYQQLMKIYPREPSVLSKIFFGQKSFAPQFMILASPALNGPNIAYIKDPATTKLVLDEMKKRESLIDFAYKTINTTFGRSILKEIVFRTNKELQEKGDVLDIMQKELNNQLDYITRQALLTSGDDLISHDRREELAQVTIPSLFVAGEKDIVVIPEDTKDFSQRVSKGFYTEVKDAPHMLVITHYEQVAKEISKFLKESVWR